MARTAMKLKAYAVWLFVLIAVCIAFIASVNFIIDPYRFFNSTDIAGVNKNRVHFFYHQLQTKPYALRRAAAEAVVLGTSRAGAGIATDHPGWGDLDVYNYGLAGSSSYLNWRNYQHAKASGNLKRVLITLDMYMFNIHHNPETARVYLDYEQRLAVTPSNRENYLYPVRWLKDTADMLLPLDTLLDSLSTVWSQSKVESDQSRMATIFPSGWWISDVPPNMAQRNLFRAMERQYMTEMWFPPPSRAFAFVDEKRKSKFEYLRRILEDAYREDIEVTLVFFPFHARLAESMRAVGLWPFFEKWKKDVVLLNEDEAKRAGQPAYPVWDFTGYNKITTEVVPSPRDRRSRMRWHTDATHVTRLAGDLLQDKIWGVAATTEFSDFGRKVNSSNVDANNAEINAARTKYVKMFPDDVREIVNEARKSDVNRVHPEFERDS